MAHLNMLRKCVHLALTLALCQFLAPTIAAAASDRVALLIGNGAYRNAPQLPNPPNDAQAMALVLQRMGFDVISDVNLDRAGMERRIREFLRKSETATISLLFYAGHGMQAEDRNYLLPIDAKLETVSDLTFEAIQLDKIVDNLNDPARTNIIILDACRDNPLVRSFSSRSNATRSANAGSGFAAYSAVGRGTLIAYATAPGRTALDGDATNSPFTKALLQHIATPGLEVRQMLTRVRADVLAATHDAQTPWDNSSLIGDVYLAGLSPQNPAPVIKPAAQTSRSEPSKNVHYSYIVGLDAAGDNFLALRSEPSLTRGLRLMKLAPNALFEVMSAVDDWRQIKLSSGEIGWAYSKYIACCKQVGGVSVSQPSEPGRSAYIVGLDPRGDNFLALRSEPSSHRGVRLTKMPPDATFEILSTVGEWHRIRLRTGERGWAYSKYIACCR